MAETNVDPELEMGRTGKEDSIVVLAVDETRLSKELKKADVSNLSSRVASKEMFNFDTLLPATVEFEPLRNAEKMVYDGSRAFMTNILALLVGLLLSLAWGLIVGIFQFTVIWILRPSIRLIEYLMTPMMKFSTGIAGGMLEGVFGWIKKSKEPNSQNDKDMV